MLSCLPYEIELGIDDLYLDKEGHSLINRYILLNRVSLPRRIACFPEAL